MVEWPFTYLEFHLDANRANAGPSNPNSELDELERWHKRGVITLQWPLPAYDEVQRGDPSGARKRKVVGSSLVAVPYIETAEERTICVAIEAAVFAGGARNDNERRDVENLFTARKYQRHFITADGLGGKRRGILTHRGELERLGVSVMTDHEAVRMVHEELARRATFEKDRAQREGRPVAEWVGCYESGASV